MANDGAITLGVADGAYPTVSASALGGMLFNGAITLGVADGAYPTVSASALGGMLFTGAVSLGAAVSGSYPQLAADYLTGGSGDGDCRPGDPDNFNPQTPLTLAATVLQGAAFHGALALPAWLADASLEPAQALPLYRLDAQALGGGVGAGAVALPPWDAAAAQLTGAAADGDLLLPVFGAAGDTGPGADLLLPVFDVAAALAAGTVGAGAAQLAGATLDATALHDGSGAGQATLPLPSAAGVAGATARTVGAVLIAPLAAGATGYAGAAGAGAATLARWQAGAAGFAANAAGADVRLPVPVVDGAGVAGRLATLYRMLALNPRTNAVTEYSNMPFNSFAAFNGVVLGASADGIMALTGETDNGAPIDASMTSGLLDFDAAQHKRITAGYVGYRATGALTFTLAADAAPANSYPLAPRAAGLHPSRTLFGRGAKGRYWQWKLNNVGGAGFTLDALAFDVDVMARRV